MATFEEAIIKAHREGDYEGAKRLAEIARKRSENKTDLSSDVPIEGRYHGDGQWERMSFDADKYADEPEPEWVDIIKAVPQTIYGGAQQGLAGTALFLPLGHDETFRGMIESGEANIDAAQREHAPGLSNDPLNLKAGALSGARSVGTMIPALLAAPYGGLASTTLGIFTSTGGLGYDEALDAGLPAAQAFMVGGAKGGIEALTERIPLGVLFKGAGKKGIKALAKQAIEFMAKETLQEVSAEALEAALDKLTIDPEMDANDFFDRMQRMFASLPFAVGGTYVAGSAAAKTVRKGQQKGIEAAKKQQAEIDAETDMVVEYDENNDIRVSEPGRAQEVILSEIEDTVDQPIEEAATGHTPGKNWVPMIDTTKLPANNTTTLKKPAVTSKLLVKALKKLGLNVHQGKYPNRIKARGYYRHKDAETGTNPQELRVEDFNDPEVTLHEIGHWLNDILFNGYAPKASELREPWNAKTPQEYRADNYQQIHDEILQVSYRNDMVHEGFAEFFRVWATQPSMLEKVAPNALKWWYSVLEDSSYKTDKGKPVGPILQGIQQDFLNYFGQGALFRAKSKNVRGSKLNESLSTGFSKFRQKYFDKFEAFRRVEKLLNDGVVAVGGLYETIRMTLGAQAQAAGALEFGYPVQHEDGTTTYKGKGLKQILKEVRKAGGSVEDFAQYALGLSAYELKKQDRENLFTKDEIRAFINLGRNHPEYKQAFRDYQKFNQGVVQYAIDNDYITQEQRDNWRRDWYIPMYRIMEEGGGKPGRKSVEGLTTATKMLTGGTGNVDNVLDNMVRNAQHLIVESVKNRSRRKGVDALRSLKGVGNFITPASKESIGVQIDSKQIRDMALDLLGLKGIPEENMPKAARALIEIVEAKLWQREKNGYVTLWKHGQAPNIDQAVGVIRNGKAEYYKVEDPLLYESFKAMTPPTLSAGIGLLNSVRRFGQSTITLTPDFIMRNLARDTLHAWVFSKYGFRPFIDTAKGLKSAFLKDQDYQDFLANGGGMASYILEPGMLERFSNREIRKGNAIDHMSETMWHSPKDFLLRLADATEVATRLGEYKQAIKKGASKSEAAYAGREVSTDFAVNGSSQGWTNFQHTIMFLKAAQAGMDRAYRGFTDKGGEHKLGPLTMSDRAAIMTKTGTLMAASVALYLMNRGDDDYNKKENWEKFSYWHFKISDSDNGGPAQWFRMPKIWEIGAMTSLAEKSVEAYLDGFDSEDAGVMANIMFDQLKLEYLPQAFKPLVELALNKNRFTERPIETKAEQERARAERFGPNTSETAVQLGRKLGMSPKRIEHLIKGYFNTWGLYGLMVADSFFWDDQAPERRLGDYPVLRTFYPNPVPKGTQAMSDFWDFAGEFGEVMNSAKYLQKAHRPEWAQELYENEGAKIAMTSEIESVKKIYRDINKQIAAIRSPLNDSQTAAEKADDIEKLKLEQQKAIGEFMDEARKEFPDWHPRMAPAILDLIRG